MILSDILFPNESICPLKEMYFKGNDFEIEENKTISLKKDSILSGSTYFNSFSLEKWRKYTVIDNLKLNLNLKGSGVINLFSIKIENGEMVYKNISSLKFKVKKETTFSLDINVRETSVVYFEIEASEDSIFFGGNYSTEIDEEKLNKVNVAIGICTFKREEFVIANLQRLSEVISSDNSPLYNKAKVFVSDNGQSLPKDEINNDIIKIVYNKNLGGAGGFTRTLIEALNSGEEFTNFIFMDDDIILDVAAVEKNFRFLSMLKPEHKKSVIGGAMFSTDEMYKQFENAAKWQDTRFIFNQRDVDLRDNLNIVANEQPWDTNYNAWCYCCIPFEVVKTNNLPIPIFFHMDDVEYGLRNGLPVITLNGINVWHLYKKVLINAKNDYYDVRNKLIMLSEIDPNCVSTMAHTYLNSFTTEALKYHYARSINALDGILDFCKGFDYFKNLDTMKKHSELFNNVKWVDAPDDIKLQANVSLKDGRGREFKLRSALKTIFSKKKKQSVVYDDNGVNDALASRKVYVYSAQEEKCIEYKKNLWLALKCFIKNKKVKHALKHKLNKAIQSYNRGISQVQNIDFWNNYLGLPKVEYGKRVLFAASDNDMTSGAFRSMVALNVLLKKKYNLETMVLLPRVGNGTRLLKENNIRYTIIDSEDWIVRKEATSKDIKNKEKLIKKSNKKAKKLIKKFLQEEKFDLIHINTSYHYLVADVAKELNIPVVWHIREFLEEDQGRKFVKKTYAHKLMNHSKRIVAISDSIKEKYLPVFGDKLVRIYNGIDVNTYYDENKEILNDNKIIFIAVGVIVEYKGQHLLLEACGKLKQKGFNNFEVWLAGSNHDVFMKTINEIIRKYDLKDNVKILGPRSDVDKLYRKADIMFVGSRSEAFGRITVEAMMSGLLVIGSNSAGTKELLEDKKTGLLFNIGDVEDLCEKIEYAISNKKEMKKIASEGRSDVVEKYSAETNADNVYSLYQNLWEEN